MSGREYKGFNFSVLFRKHQLNQVPKTLAQSVAAQILLHPKPDAINLRVPPLVEVSELFDHTDGLFVKAGLGIEWLKTYVGTPERSLAHQRLGSVRMAGGLHQWTYFNNYGTTPTASCATRVLQLLGNVYPITDNNDLGTFTEYDTGAGKRGDPYKLGMLYAHLCNYLNLSWHPKYMIPIQLGAESDLTDLEKIRVITKRAQKDFPLAKVLIFLGGKSHVSYMLKTDFLTEQLELAQMFSSATRYSTGKGGSALNGTRVDQELLESYPPASGRAGARVHLDLRTVLKTLKLNSQYALRYMLHKYRNRNNWEEIIVSTFLLVPHLVQPAGDYLTFFLLNNAEIWMRLNFVEAVKWLKQVHGFVRIQQRLPGYGLCALRVSDLREMSDLLYGLDTLGGRSELFTLDFPAEAIMRAVDPVIRGVPKLNEQQGLLEFDTQAFERYEDEAVKEAVDSVLQDDIPLESFAHWYSRRMFWAASGGAPGAKISWQDATASQTSDAKEEKLRLNKRGALLAIPEKHYKAILEKALVPVQWSVKAIKYEPGKLRSILNTSMELYIFQGYLLDHFDAHVRSNTWYASANSGLSRLSAHTRRLEKLARNVGLMWDFADFNINHTFSGQKKVLAEVVHQLINRASKNGSPLERAAATSDMIRIKDWLLKARDTTFVVDNDSKLVLQVVRSLQSGERATSFINSMRNEVDHLITRRVGLQLFKEDLSPDPGDKSGDDVFLTTNEMRKAILMCVLYNLCGFAGQVSKILVSYPDLHGSRGEFLKYAYDSSSNTVRGYPLRALSGVVHGEFFHDPIISPAERGATLIEQHAKLKRRGINLPENLLNEQLKQATRIVYTEGKRKHEVVVPQELIYTPAALGGVGVTMTATGTLVSDHLRQARLLREVLASDPVPAIVIPSGEGKTTLSQYYPNVFVDHDAVLDSEFGELRATAQSTGDWSTLNKYLRNKAVGVPGVLLTWSPETVPQDAVCIGAIMLRQPSKLRANVANRRAIMAYKNLHKRFSLTLVDSHNEIVNLAILKVMEYYAARQYSRVRFVDTDGNVGKMPQLSLGSLNASSVLKKAKTSIIDYSSLHRYGAEHVVDQVNEDILGSGLTAALPKKILSTAIAKQAKDLDEYLNRHTFQTFIPPKVKLEQSVVMLNMGSIVREHLSTTKDHRKRFTIADYPAVTHFKHHYNSLVTMIRPAGFSSGVSLSLAIDAQIPQFVSGKLGKLYRFINVAVGNLRTGSTKEADAMSKLLKWLHATSALMSSVQHSSDMIYKYVAGDLSLYPMSAPHLSPELNSIARDLALHYFEHYLIHLLVMDELYVQELITILDDIAIVVILKILQELCPGFIIRD
ncbi:RNA-dependent RNA polymerase [viral metagenome]|uniref:RNA-dependent RNA polymerase n=1 Tax=viral metagenome TaxID=1070528 RepID=A0A6L2ZJB4_9ZZZZ